MLLEPKNLEYYRNYKFSNYLYFERKNFTFDRFIELYHLINNCLYGTEVYRVRLEYPNNDEPEYIEVNSFEEVREIVLKHWVITGIALGFIKKNSPTNDDELADFIFYFRSDEYFKFSIQGYCKNHLTEFYDFFTELSFFKDNNINPVKMSLISPNLQNYVENYFIKLFNETGKLEYRDVANCDFNLSSGIGWTLLKPKTSEYYLTFFKTKTFGKLPLLPFEDYSCLNELPIYRLTKFNNGAIWLQLTEDVCPWDDDPAYIQALHSFVDAYIEKRDEYFYSLPVEVQNEMLGNLKPNS